jgi:hypothetical protein
MNAAKHIGMDVHRATISVAAKRVASTYRDLTAPFPSERGMLTGWVEKGKERDSNPNGEDEISDGIQHRCNHHFLEGATSEKNLGGIRSSPE